jgi:hypothetical protein
MMNRIERALAPNVVTKKVIQMSYAKIWTHAVRGTKANTIEPQKVLNNPGLQLGDDEVNRKGL